jgi:hypothetical protein
MPLKSSEWSLNPLTPPWGNAPSIYIHLRDNPNTSDLPDEKRETNKIRFAPGAWDGVLSHHMAISEPQKLPDRAGKLEQALENLLRFSTNENLKALYETVTSEQMYPLADELMKRAAERVPHVQNEVAAIGRYFAVGADNREATKFGILLLASAGDKSDIKTLETLARHDEFTLFAAVACTRLVDDPEQCMWRLAQNVHGWGRIQLVERLDGTVNPEIQNWMLREGFRNLVVNNYLAVICARTGKLHEVLQEPSIDPALLDSSADLLSAIMEGGPSADMDDYEHAAQALAGYLNHVVRALNPKLDHLVTVHEILRFLEYGSRWEGELANGWSLELRKELRELCNSILSRDGWRSQVERELESQDRHRFYVADTAAGILGLNTWNQHFERVRKAPLGTSWFRLLQLTDDSNIDQVLNFAGSVLPLDKIATGPADDLGLGPEFQAEQALDWVLQDLSRFPGRGWPLIKTGLQSRVVRNRNMALKALLAWAREQWPAEAYSLLQQASRLEPNEDLRQRLAQAVTVQ